MPSESSRLDIVMSVDETMLRPIVRTGVILGAVVFLLVLLAALPGLRRLLPLEPLSLSTVVIAGISLVVAVGLIGVAPRLGSIVEDAIAAPTALVTAAAGIAKNLVLFTAVLIAYQGVGVVARPLLGPVNAVWIYDLIFLVFALGPFAMVAYHVYNHLDAVTDMFTRHIMVTIDTTAPASMDTHHGYEPFSDGAETADQPTDDADTGGTEPVVLTKEEQVLAMLDESGGRMLQKNIVQATDWSKATVSRVLSEMEDAGEVTRIDVGKGNLVTLAGDEPENAKPPSSD